MSDSDLGWALFHGAYLTRTNLSHCTVGFTIFADVDLSQAKGLDTIEHEFSSTLGIDTINRSKGKIPQAFLRGVGVPDDFIAFVRSLVAQPVEPPSCFISYSTKEQELAERLHADLQNNGVRCWLASRDIRGGGKLHDQIDAAISNHERLLLILSEHSINSEWVKTEIARARQKELNQSRPVLFPISVVPFEKIQHWKCFDADTGKDMAREVREYFVPDFSNWKEDDSYRKSFERLLRDLKAKERRPR